jgi:tRNA dimethylallyltransferase
MKRLIALVGPTASGKTALAEAVAAEGRVRLISADSQQAVRSFDLGTAKPGAATRSQWALVDVTEPGLAFSVGEFCRRAAVLCAEAWDAGRIPLVCGGTGLYVKALLEGLAEIPDVPAALREAWELRLRREGLEAMVLELERRDPVLAARVDRKNPRRVLRGLEVQAATGRPLSQWQSETTRPAIVPEETLYLGLDPGRDALERRIAERTDALLAQGWFEEVKSLRDAYGLEILKTSAAIGYPELAECLAQGRASSEARERIVFRTRQYARRQRTWFRAQTGLRWEADPGLALAALREFMVSGKDEGLGDASVRVVPRR